MDLEVALLSSEPSEETSEETSEEPSEPSEVSWLYVFLLSVQYFVGYYLVYLPAGWQTRYHTSVRVFGDVLMLSFLGGVMACLPWHKWRVSWKSVCWSLGTALTFKVYGYLCQLPLFETSLDSNKTDAQRAVYYVTGALLLMVLVYWGLRRSAIFYYSLFSVVLLEAGSYVVCWTDELCQYHVHHWWVGLVFVFLSTSVLETSVDYLLQGVFWAFVIESFFNYAFVDLGEFFV